MSRIDLLRDGLVRAKGEGSAMVGSSFEAWLEESPDAAAGVAAPERSPTATGSCAICKERDSTAVCHQCGRSVCARDHWVMFGLCRGCLPEDAMKRARARTKPPPDLGIKWVDER